MEHTNIAKDSVHSNGARIQPQFRFNQKALELRENNAHESWFPRTISRSSMFRRKSNSLGRICVLRWRRRRWRPNNNNHAFGVRRDSFESIDPNHTIKINKNTTTFAHYIPIRRREACMRFHSIAA